MKRIKLTQGKFAIVDDEDFKFLNQFNWHYSDYGKTGYARRRQYTPTICFIRMHRVILNTPKNMQTDHINGNGLDNRRKNLRVVTKAQNMMNKGNQKNNTSGYKGVSWHKQNDRWRAYIKKDKKQISLGLYDTKEQAAKAYNQAAKEYFGEFALFNKIK